MKFTGKILLLMSVGLSAAVTATAQQHLSNIADNAALRYWSAFSALQDASISNAQAKKLNEVLDGTTPYQDAEYKVLLDKNALALRIMTRGTLLVSCDWGLDYQLGPDLPVEYARKALALGRLNSLYVLHLLQSGKLAESVHSFEAGLRFAHDVGVGGTLFANTVADKLLISHITTMNEVLRTEQMSAAQRSELSAAVERVSEGVDWLAAARREFEVLRRYFASNPSAAAALNRIASPYLAVLDEKPEERALTQAFKDAPKEVVSLVPNVDAILQQKQALSSAIHTTRSLLR